MLDVRRGDDSLRLFFALFTPLFALFFSTPLFTLFVAALLLAALLLVLGLANKSRSRSRSRSYFLFLFFLALFFTFLVALLLVKLFDHHLADVPAFFYAVSIRSRLMVLSLRRGSRMPRSNIVFVDDVSLVECHEDLTEQR